ncbi:MAG: hypothetical protein V8Q32_00595, partial [Anaerotignum faecicola]
MHLHYKQLPYVLLFVQIKIKCQSRMSCFGYRIESSSTEYANSCNGIKLGSLWLGLYSNQRNELKRFSHLPDYVNPLMLLVSGYAKVKKEPVERYLEERVHFDSYSSKTIFD